MMSYIFENVFLDQHEYVVSIDLEDWIRPVRIRRIDFQDRIRRIEIRRDSNHFAIWNSTDSRFIIIYVYHVNQNSGRCVSRIWIRRPDFDLKNII